MKKTSYHYVKKQEDGWWIAYVYSDSGRLQARLAEKTEKSLDKRAEEVIKRLEEGSFVRI